jgi:aspartyl protease family protein
MLRSSLIVAVIACIVGAYAPSLFPSLFQAMNGSGGGSAPQPIPTVALAPPPAPASASRDESYRVAEIYADRGGQYSTDVVVNGVIVHMMIDTGATFVALSAETASRLGLSLCARRSRTGDGASGGTGQSARHELLEAPLHGRAEIGAADPAPVASAFTPSS